jgi:diguanylate cyclase (GGDEF)-like protein
MCPERKRLTIGIIVDWISGWGDLDYYQSMMISGVGDFAREHDVNLICYITGKLGSPHGWDRSRNLLFHFINDHHLDGLLALPGAVGAFHSDDMVLKVLNSYDRIPIVTLGDQYGDFHAVVIDNYSGMRQVVDHLIESHGCRKIAFIKGAAGNREADIRYRAYLDALEAHDIPFAPELVQQGDFLFDSGVEAIKSYASNGTVFDSLVGANDNMAIGALTELHNRLGTFPVELPIAGFDDAESSRFHALTTVKQSFYDEARIAANMLLRLINGEQVPKTVEIPAEMVLRTSCGCLPDSIKNTFIGTKSEPAGERAESFIMRKRTMILQQLEETFHASASVSDMQEAGEREPLWRALLDAVEGDMRAGAVTQFPVVWNSIIYWAIMKRIGLPTIHDILSCMRRNTIPFLSERSDLMLLEDMFQMARLVVNDVVQRTGASLNYISSLQAERLDHFAESLIVDLDWKAQMDLVTRDLPEFGIRTSCIALYEDPVKPLDYSRLILAFDEDRRIDTGENGIRFQTSDMLPESVMAVLKGKRLSLVVQALHQGDNQIGFALFSFEEKVNKAYEIIRYRLSVALKGALLFDSIKNQALDLERQVMERTRELSRMNDQLIQEITKRERAEQQLRQALHDLAVYNQELHSQSVRDEMTGLYNRRGFMTLGSLRFEAARSRSQGLLLLYADLDGLKSINDKHGHAEGDYAIVKSAEILQHSFGEEALYARLGGDEFTVLVEDAVAGDEKECRTRLALFCDLFNEQSKKPYPLCISVGSAYLEPDSELSFGDLMIIADQELYKEKHRKKSPNAG